MSWLSATTNGKGKADVLAPALPAEPVKALAMTQGNNITFRKAVKYDAKGRVALVGPPGSGKSYTMLLLARALAGPEGKIAAVDTEHGSLSKYADLFDFDVIELDSYSPDTFQAALRSAEAASYDVFCCDSLSHFWMGKDGALEFVDMAGRRDSSGNGFAGWKAFRPHERQMVDDMIGSPCHIVCTMRTKTDYQMVTDDKGNKKRMKVGLAPVQRDGLEYEFDLVGYMDEDNTFIVDKTRCSAYAQKAIAKPGPSAFAPLVQWLQGAARGGRALRPEPRIDTGGHPLNTKEAAQYVAEQKIAGATVLSQAPWRNMAEVDKYFGAVRERVGEVVWREQLEACGWREFPEMRSAIDSRDKDAKVAARQKARELYWHLDAIARKEGK